MNKSKTKLFAFYASLFLTNSFVFNLALSDSFAEEVAGKCRGEASFAVTQCACTVKNRLAEGWSQGRVLSAYYATTQKPTGLDIEAVTDVLSDSMYCDPRLYFMYSKEDVRYLGITQEPILIVKDEGNSDKAVLFFERFYKKRR